jgi:hypothetical protein
MKIRFFSQTRLILSFVPVGMGGKIAEVGGEKIFSYANLLFLNKSINKVKFNPTNNFQNLQNAMLKSLLVY